MGILESISLRCVWCHVPCTSQSIFLDEMPNEVMAVLQKKAALNEVMELQCHQELILEQHLPPEAACWYRRKGDLFRGNAVGVPHSCVVSDQSFFLYVSVLHQELFLWVRVTCCNIPVTCCLQFTWQSNLCACFSACSWGCRKKHAESKAEWKRLKTIHTSI